eukprot:TRINITY_DN1842_c0_g1_i2.p1 TRINITY_DN1842_c0_g1~~TRINITY_DN1842_c0_g1_i2.p1  ORF type:complete len:250 (+),score=48.42 TRINITY_DN1842_c0_g1_i2:89-838(+)
MFRQQYDSDITTWSPQGRLFQIEYAMEAVKQGSAVVGVKSKTHAVVAALKRAPSNELAAYQQKIFKIDDHMGIAIAGLTADARVLCKHMRTECINHKYVYDTPMQVNRLVVQIADKAQIHTQKYGRRPYGVGLLVIGYDQTGAHLFETCPSGNYSDWKAISIGARSQSAKTYLEKKFDTFENLPMNSLIKHALLALKETTGQQSEGLTIKNCAVAVVGLNQKFELYEGSALSPFLDNLDTFETDETMTT